MGIEYSVCQEADLLSKRIIKDNHPHLLDAKVVFLFADKQDKNGASIMIQKGDRNIFGTARKVSGLNAFLAGDIGDEEGREFFVILITKYSWGFLKKEQKLALVDHELCHCWYDRDKGALSMIDHDVEEFTQIIKRHGVWNEGLNRFFSAGAQSRLPFTDPMPVAESSDVAPEAEPAGNGKSKKGGKPAPVKKAAVKKTTKRRQPSANA